MARTRSRLGLLRRVIRALHDAIVPVVSLDRALDGHPPLRGRGVDNPRGSSAGRFDSASGTGRSLTDIAILTTRLVGTRDTLTDLHYEIVALDPDSGEQWAEVDRLTETLRRELTTYRVVTDEALRGLARPRGRWRRDGITDRYRSARPALRRVSRAIDRLAPPPDVDPTDPERRSDPFLPPSPKADLWDAWITRRQRGGIALSTVHIQAVVVCVLEFCLLAVVLRPYVAAESPDIWLARDFWVPLYGLLCLLVVGAVLGLRYFRRTTFWSETLSWWLPVPTLWMAGAILYFDGPSIGSLICAALTFLGIVGVAVFRETVHQVNTVRVVQHVLDRQARRGRDLVMRAFLVDPDERS